MSSENPQGPNKYKRKRKKTFLKNARKYGKRGYYGRGNRLDSEIYEFFINVMDNYKNGMDSDEEKAMAMLNIFEHTEDQEIQCFCNQVGCQVIETFLPYASEAIFEKYFEVFSSDLRPLCCDRFASHVLEALVTQSCKASLNSSTHTEEFVQKARAFVVKVSKFLLNNLEDYIWDTYGNHVIRTCLENLAQVPREKEENKKRPGKKPEEPADLVELEAVPEEYVQIVQECGERILCWPQFGELCNEELTSGFLQVLLKCLKKVDRKLLKRYTKKLITEKFASGIQDAVVDPNSFAPIFLSKPGMMLLEAALNVSSKKEFTQIYAECFLNRLRKLALARNTNFAVQKLVANCREKVEFEAIFEELKDSFKEIIEAGHTGIILSLGQACKRLSSSQGTFAKSLVKGLDCAEPEERQNDLVLCLSRFQTYDVCKTQSTEDLRKEKLNLHGTLILQLLLEFNKPIRIVSGILNMPTEDVKNLFTNTMGSHIVDSYVNSAFVGEKSREKLVKKMAGTYQELASTKFGSRSFEALWRAANPKCKESIMEELAYRDGAWSNSDFGKIISSKVNLALFKKSREAWKSSLNAKKAKDVFADLLE